MACTSPAPTGDLDVAWRFEGIEPPERVDVYLISGGGGQSCSTVDDPASAATEVRPTRPVRSDTRFEGLPDGSRWMVVAVGAAGGAEVARGCRDRLVVTGGETLYTDLVLYNQPLDLAGLFYSTLQVMLGLPAGGAGAITEAMYRDLVDFVCALRGTCDQVSEGMASLLAIELSELTVECSWAHLQDGDLVRLEPTWTHVEGVPIAGLVSGAVVAEIPGATGVVLDGGDLVLHTEALAEVVYADVLEFPVQEPAPDLPGILPDAVAGPGAGWAVDTDLDGEADRLHAELVFEMAFTEIGVVHPFSLPWVATRRLSER